MNISDKIYSYTAAKLAYIESISGTGAGRGILANLRHGLGKKPGELPELWGIIFDGLPEELMGVREASDAEWAVYTSLTLYALHQQGHEVSMNNMNKEGISLGRAAARLVKSEDDMERILNRLNLVVTAVSSEDLAYHLRGVIQFLKNEDIPLDYAKLAKELYLFNRQEFASNIRLSWGRDFYGERYKTTKGEKENG